MHKSEIVNKDHFLLPVLFLVFFFFCSNAYLTRLCCFFLSSGHEEDFCMMCTLEAHINQVLRCSNNAVKPISVIKGLQSKSFEMVLF